jgi:hypothetical protein
MLKCTNHFNSGDQTTWFSMIAGVVTCFAARYVIKNVKVSVKIKVTCH